jgi:hypothetical protein
MYEPLNPQGHFKRVKDDCPSFTKPYNPGDRVNDDGIYGCSNCEYEAVRRTNERLPHEPTCNGHDPTRAVNGSNLSDFTLRAQPGEIIIHWNLRALAQLNPDK